MASYKLKVDRDTEEAYVRLKCWCRYNRVPIGRILNAAIRAMSELPNYKDKGPHKYHIIDIKYPRQVDIDNHLRYKRNLTRVKNNGQTAGR